MPGNTTLFCFPSPDTRDWSEDNARAQALWAAFSQASNTRIPLRFSTNPRMLLLDPAYNTRGIPYDRYMREPDLMARVILEWHYWVRHFLPGDHEHGLPGAWPLHVDFENLYDVAWLGCPVHYREGQVPDTTPILRDDNKRMLFDRGLPDPFAGEWPERLLAIRSVWEARRQHGWTWKDVPLGDVLPPCFCNTDGIFTAAVGLRGATECCMDLLEDPDYAHELLGYLYEALRNRMRAWRVRFGVPVPCDDFWLADDAVLMLSPEQYAEFVLPWHQKLYDEFATHTHRAMHLCGDAQRHFKTIQTACGVEWFDTGFPIDFAKLREDLGAATVIQGGPRVSFFLTDDPAPVVEETRRIAATGVLEGGRFIFQEGNNLPPCARLPVCEAFYEAARTVGNLA